MTTETRIGIVTGLIIVVAASVYFFYGNEKDDDGVLVSSPTRVSLPPKIPVSADKKATPQRVTRAPVRQGPGPLTNNFAQRRPPVQPLPQPSQGAQSRGDNRPLTPKPDSPVALRTAPSTELVEATWENLLKRDKPAADGATIRPQPMPRGSPSIVSNPSAAVTTLNPPSAAWPKKHTIAAGDLLSKISKEYYGDGSHGGDILAANPQIKDERRLKIGDVLTLPEPKTSGLRPSPGRTVEKPGAQPIDAALSVTASQGGKTYTVQSGDTLYTIAKKQCGNSNRWKEIQRLNKDVLKGNSARLSVGMVLKLPP